MARIWDTHTFMSFCAFATLASVRTCCITAFLTAVESISGICGGKLTSNFERENLRVRNATLLYGDEDLQMVVFG